MAMRMAVGLSHRAAAARGAPDLNCCRRRRTVLNDHAGRQSSADGFAPGPPARSVCYFRYFRSLETYQTSKDAIHCSSSIVTKKKCQFFSTAASAAVDCIL